MFQGTTAISDILQFGRDEGDAEGDAALKGDGGCLGALLYPVHAVSAAVNPLNDPGPHSQPQEPPPACAGYRDLGKPHCDETPFMLLASTPQAQIH